jgi:hypothetical protein
MHASEPDFFIDMAWLVKGSGGGLPFSIIHSFYRQRVLLVAFQRVEVAIILC